MATTISCESANFRSEILGKQLGTDERTVIDEAIALDYGSGESTRKGHAMDGAAPRLGR